MKFKVLGVFLLFLVGAATVHGQTGRNINGDWKGAIILPPQQLIILTHFQKAESSLTGSIDIPQQLVNGIKLAGLHASSDSIYFNFPTGSGLARFKGSFVTDDSIYGAFRQAGDVYPFYINRQKKEVENVKNRRYSEKKIVIQNGTLDIAGTLLLPNKVKAAPAVIFISGSGAQDRNENIFGFKPFSILADSLGQHGIASFRYDDRGVGGSNGNLASATLGDLSSDVQAIIKYLRSQKQIDTAGIGLLGHSQGASIAGHVAAQNPDIAFLILMAGPAYPISDIIIQQIQSIDKAMGLSDSLVKSAIDEQRSIYKTIREHKSLDSIRQKMIGKMLVELHRLPEKQQQRLGDLKNYAKKRVDAELAPIQTPSFKSFLFYDPSDDFEKIRIPVLALFGQLDHQVLADTNRSRMNYLFRDNTRYHSTVIDSANHLFQKSYSGLPTEYVMLKHRFAKGFVDTLIQWINQNK